MEKWPSEFTQYTGQILDGDIGRKVGFNRIAVHHFILPPHSRSSSPHAESAEEEFVFVLKGEPHLWLNGYIHQLKEGFAVGFPAGTGIAHTVINNTDSEVHLLVAGEKTKKENLCAFPINPELKETSGIWWSNPPIHPLGPHKGLPGPIRENEWATIKDSCILDCWAEPRGRIFHYPGDNETFGHGLRMSDKIGLKALGIWLEYLPEGRRSAFPHAHTHEEEFVYVLRGSPEVWLDGYTKTLLPDHFAAFPSNTGISHTLMNNTSTEVAYICIGETADFPDEKIVYPLHPLRQQECIRKNWYWTDLKPRQLGPDQGSPKEMFPDHIQFKICTQADTQAVLDIFQKSPEYFVKVEGCRPHIKTAEIAITSGPAKKHEKYFKEFLIIEKNKKPIGVLDLHANHPEEKICYLGLLLITEDLFGKDVGTECYRLAEDYIRRALQCDKIRLGVADENQVAPFWKKMGFLPNGRKYEFPGEAKVTQVQEYEKEIKR